MAYGQFTGYEPLPDMPGAYNFQTADGKALTFGGPEADQLKARLDAANAATMTAGDNAAGGFDAAAAARDLTGAPPSPAPAAPAQQQGPGGQLGYGLSVSPRGTIQKYVPGTAGVSRAQLQKADENAVAVRRGETEAVQEGTPQDQAYLDARAEGNLDQRLATQTEGERAVAAGQAEADYAQQAFEQQQRLQAEEASRQADLQTKYAREEQLKNKAFEEYSSSRVKPNRIFSSPGASLLAGLVSGIGAYAATIGKTANFAQQTLDSAVNRDISAQEAAIRIKGDKANNLLSDLRQTGMSLEQSRAVARGIQLNYAQSQLAAVRAKNAVPALQSHYDNLDQALQKSLLEANEQSRLASIDKVSRQVSKGFEHERAATRGGYVDVKDQLGTAKEVQGLQAGEANIAKTKADIAKEQAAAAKGPTASPEKRDAAGALAETAVLSDIAKGYAPNEDLPSYEARTILGKKWEDFANHWAGEGAGISAETAVKRQDLARIQAGLGEANSKLGGQGSMIGDERAIFGKAMAPGAKWGDVQRAIVMTADRAKARGQAAEAVGEAGGVVTTK